MTSLESDPFIISKDDLDFKEVPLCSRSSRLGWTLRRNLVVHIILIAIYSAVSLWVLSSSSCTTIYSNAALEDLKIRYLTKTFVNLTESPYAGDPSQAIDDAWDSLLGNIHIRVTTDELAKAGRESVSLPEGGGHLAWLGLFHELHCINMLRQWNYRDYYHSNITQHENIHWALHADHCLDLMRQSALCHADTSLTTFVWDKTKSEPMFDASEFSHRCVDADALVKSTNARQVDEKEVKRLQNPLLDNST